MKIGIWHGYLLRGTGSNIYVYNLARQLCQMGHEITLICQEDQSAPFDFVDRFVQHGQLRFERPPRFAGRCTVYQPDIAGLLPVYVWDHYAGFEVKTFLDLSQAELQRYIDLNVAALREICAREGLDLLITNHAVMSPYIARLAGGVPYISKIHGSAITFVVVHSPLYLDYAVQGLAGSAAVVCGSEFMQARLLEVLGGHLPDLAGKTRLIPAGVDTESFAPVPSRPAAIAALQQQLAQAGAGGKTPAQEARLQELSAENAPALLAAINGSYDQRTPDSHAGAKLAACDWERERTILFFGKFLPSKGVFEIICSAPDMLTYPASRLILVGFGTYREHLEGLLLAMDRGDFALFGAILRSDPATAHLAGAIPPERFASWQGRQLSQRVIFTGILRHEELCHLLPCADVVLVPSVVPEAFGMVAAEALSCGVLPLCSDFSGLKDVLDAMAEFLPPEVVALARLDKDRLLEQLATRVRNALDQMAAAPELRQQCRQVTVRNFSWETIARGFLAAAPTHVQPPTHG